MDGGAAAEGRIAMALTLVLTWLLLVTLTALLVVLVVA